LRPGGAHIFTTPKYKGKRKSENRAIHKNGEIVHLAEPEYHRNPIDANDSLVTVHYGDDILRDHLGRNSLPDHNLRDPRGENRNDCRVHGSIRDPKAMIH
jgi:hypothetical protein